MTNEERAPKELMVQIIEALAKAVSEVTEDLGLDAEALGNMGHISALDVDDETMTWVEGPSVSDEAKAQHQAVAVLHRSVMTTMRGATDPSDLADGDRVRQLAWKLFMQSIYAGDCVHEAEVAWDLLPIADRLDLADISEGVGK